MITINSENCVGCGLCAVVYPEGFQLDDNTGIAKVTSQNLDLNLVDEAIQQCPVEAISL